MSLTDGSRQIIFTYELSYKTYKVFSNQTRSSLLDEHLAP